MSEFFEARILAEFPDWTFGAHQAAMRAEAAGLRISVRRQFPHLAAAERDELAASWRSDSGTGRYFAFAAAPGGNGLSYNGGELSEVVVGALFVSALFQELDDVAPAALAALLDQWAEQRRLAGRARSRRAAVREPSAAVLIPRDENRWPARSWARLRPLDLESAEFDDALLRWDDESGLWLAVPH
ncbi:MAG: hypothetical protein ACRDVE_20365 [Actinocrinis sp.]